ncbi:MAG: C40 family peptidase [Pirellulales bacterium]|nr:C40 family peptidase [Pirellulales bacterium]
MLRLAPALLLVISSAAVARSQEASPAVRPVDKASLKVIAEQIEPGLRGQADRLAAYVDYFRHKMVSDVRLFAFAAQAEPEAAHGVRLAGYVEFPETRAAIAEYFAILGFDPVLNDLETLPTEALGEERFGFVKSFNALSYAEPAEKEVVTDCLLGDPLFLLREEEGHFLVHGGDGYVGWVAAKNVHRVDEGKFAEYLQGPRVFLLTDHPSKDSAAGVEAPAGGRLKFVREEGDDYVVLLPTGEPGKVAQSNSVLRQPPRERIDVICGSARELLGTPYLWGGKTKRGVDCSGLVQVSFAAGGVSVPRDADEQCHVGQLTGARWSRAAMQRGDTLYFLNGNGRVSHTGLYLGDGQFIHAVSPVVRINSFNPDDENYDPARDASFAFARRLWK